MLRYLLLTAITLLPFGSVACDCKGDYDVESNWRGAYQVFIADVIRADTSGTLHGQHGMSLNAYTLRIVETLKDSVYAFRDYDLRTFVVKQHSGSCEYGFSLHKRYVVFAYKSCSDLLLISDLCGRTGLVQSFTPRELHQLRELGRQFRTAERLHTLTDAPQATRPEYIHAAWEKIAVLERRLFWARVLAAVAGAAAAGLLGWRWVTRR